SVHPGAQCVVTPLPGFFQLIDKLDDARERHQHEQRHHDGGENGFTDIAVKNAESLHHTAPLRTKRARMRRIGTLSHRFNTTASSRYRPLTTHIQIIGSILPLPPFDLIDVCSRKNTRYSSIAGSIESTRP